MFGYRLRLARKQAGLTMQSLAEAMSPKVTAQAISKYENGKMLPSSAVLVGLGKTLNVSLDFLMGTQVEELETIEFRRHSGASSRNRAFAEAIIMDSLERYLAIEHILGIKPSLEWMKDSRCDNLENENQIDDQADSLRSIWNLGNGPIPSMCNLLEEKGIKVVEANLPERINGMSCHVIQNGNIVSEAVLVSSRINIERKRFTLAHELAHKIISKITNPAIKLESAMDRFAGAFLVPAQSLRSEVGDNRQRITNYEIFRLKKIYGVSATSLLMRLGQVGILSSAYVKRAFSTYARPWRKTEPDPIGVEHRFSNFEKPRRFKQLVVRAVSEQLISPVRASELLNESPESFMKQINDSEIR